MKHSIQFSGKQAKAALTGKIYAHDAGLVRDELIDGIERGAAEVRIDLSDVAYIDSTGLGVLVTIHKRTKERNGHLVLTGVKGMVEQLIRRTRLDTVLTIE